MHFNKKLLLSGKGNALIFVISYIRSPRLATIAKLSINKVKECVSSYGTVKEFYESNSNIMDGNYDNPHAASSLLRKGSIYLNKCRLKVEASPTWEQPFSTCSNNQFQSKDGNIGITHLNDDCLLNIFKMLDSRDQIRLSQSHVRFELVFSKLVCPYFTPSQLRFCELYSAKLSDWELWYFLKHAGAYIKDLELHSRSCNSDLFYELMNFCTQVLRIQIAYVKLPKLSITPANNMLQEIELYMCDLCDGGVELLAQLEHLRDLALVECPNITGNTLVKLEKIQRLSVFGCKLLTPTNLEAACIAMNLKYLDIRYAFCLHTVKILIHCCGLETLKLSADECMELSSITKCDVLKSSLKSLEFYEIHDRFFKLKEALSNNGLHNLETLKLSGEIDFVCNIDLEQHFPRLRTLWLCFTRSKTKLTDVSNIHKLEHLEELYVSSAIIVDEEFFVSIVNNCYMLRRLIIRNCPYLSDYLFISCYDTMQNRANHNGAAFKPLTIYLSKTYIRKAIMEPSFYNNNYIRVIRFKKLPAKGSFKENDLFENIPTDFCPCISDEEYSSGESDSE